MRRIAFPLFLLQTLTHVAAQTVTYRLSPRAHNPQYTEDAAAAVAWTVLSTVTAFME